MKNKKLNLSDLKVKSFVTDLETEKENTVKGGGGNTIDRKCYNTVGGFPCQTVVNPHCP